MAGKYARKTSKKPVAIAIVSVVAVIAAVVAVVFILGRNGGGDIGETTQPASTVLNTTAAATSAAVQTELSETTAMPEQSETSQESSDIQPATGEEESSSEQSIIVPASGSGEPGYFNSTYVPYRAVDGDTGSEVSLREVFGAAFSEGVLTFNDDGSFTDSLTVSEPKKGAYIVEGEGISATYSDDRNMQITVNEWENGEPVDFTVNYGGYEVYFH